MVGQLSLDDLDPEVVKANIQILAAMLQEKYPGLNMLAGAIHDNVVQPHAILHTMEQQQLTEYNSARSLRVASEDPDSIPDEYVDDLLSNFNLERTEGRAAYGEVTIVLSQPYYFTVPARSYFSVGDLLYYTETSFAAKADITQVVEDTDRLLLRTNDNKYNFTLTVVADDSGAKYLIKKNTTVVMSTPPPFYYRAFAATDFINGADRETNSQLISRVETGIAARTPTTRMSIAAMIANDTRFEDTLAISVVGSGDIEMSRDRHGLWPGSTGGAADVYVRTAENLTTAVKTYTATHVSGDLWSVTLSVDDSSGVIRVAGVTDSATSQTAEDVELTRLKVTVDDDEQNFVYPNVTTDIEARYSRFQQIHLSFSLDIGDSTDDREVLVELDAMPNIAEMQDWLSDRNIAPFGSNLMVKSATPVFVSVGLRVNVPTAASQVSESDIQTAIALAINQQGFSDKLYASQLYNAASPYLTLGQRLSDLVIYATTIAADESIETHSSSSVLVVPTNASNYQSKRTIQFFCTQQDVSVTINVTPD